MRRCSGRFGWLLVACCVARCGAAEPEAGWIELFNGRDLSGWTVVGDNDECWAVVDGLLRPVAQGGWLSTEREFDDFELDAEYRLAPGSNSGVFLRAPHEGRTSRMGMEIQLIDDFTDAYGPLEPWQLSGSLYDVAAADRGAARPAGEWQQVLIRAQGRRLTVKLNGIQVLDVDLDGFPQARDDHPGLQRERGFIGLQNYGGRDIAFRRIRLRELSAPRGN